MTQLTAHLAIERMYREFEVDSDILERYEFLSNTLDHLRVSDWRRIHRIEKEQGPRGALREMEGEWLDVHGSRR